MSSFGETNRRIDMEAKDIRLLRYRLDWLDGFLNVDSAHEAEMTMLGEEVNLKGDQNAE